MEAYKLSENKWVIIDGWKTIKLAKLITGPDGEPKTKDVPQNFLTAHGWQPPSQQAKMDGLEFTSKNEAEDFISSIELPKVVVYPSSRDSEFADSHVIFAPIENKEKLKSFLSMMGIGLTEHQQLRLPVRPRVYMLLRLADSGVFPRAVDAVQAFNAEI